MFFPSLNIVLTWSDSERELRNTLNSHIQFLTRPPHPLNLNQSNLLIRNQRLNPILKPEATAAITSSKPLPARPKPVT
jgi:hypothetical protein